MNGHCTFEEIADEDLIDAARTLPGGYSWGAITNPPGMGVDPQIVWATREIALAEGASNSLDQQRLLVNAVTHARRALACLVDWYLASYNFSRCSGAPRDDDAGGKAELLVRRGVIDDLSSRVLKRAVAVRNIAEHQYSPPTAEQAEDAVELIRRVVHFVTQTTDPSKGPWLFGTPLHGYSCDGDTVMATFDAWTEFCFVICGFFDPPWLGVVEPTGDKSANVRRCYFRNLRLPVYEEILTTLEHKYRFPGSSASALVCKEQAIAAGLNG